MSFCLYCLFSKYGFLALSPSLLRMNFSTEPLSSCGVMLKSWPRLPPTVGSDSLLVSHTVSMFLSSSIDCKGRYIYHPTFPCLFRHLCSYIQTSNKKGFQTQRVGKTLASPGCCIVILFFYFES